MKPIDLYSEAAQRVIAAVARNASTTDIERGRIYAVAEIDDRGVPYFHSTHPNINDALYMAASFAHAPMAVFDLGYNGTAWVVEPGATTITMIRTYEVEEKA